MLQSVERLPLLPIQSRKNSLAHIEPTARLSGNFLVVPEGKVSEDIRSSKDSCEFRMFYIFILFYIDLYFSTCKNNNVYKKNYLKKF